MERIALKVLRILAAAREMATIVLELVALPPAGRFVLEGEGKGGEAERREE